MPVFLQAAIPGKFKKGRRARRSAAPSPDPTMRSPHLLVATPARAREDRGQGSTVEATSREQPEGETIGHPALGPSS